VVQAAIAEFHSLALALNERLESFINRLTAAMRRLHALGQTDVDLNVYCLGRLKESLAHDSRFEQIAMTLRINTRLTWEEAVEMLLSYDQTLAPGLDQTGVKTAAKGVDVPEGGEVVRRRQAEVRTLNKALLHKGAPNSGKDREAVKGFTGKCFDCEGLHKKADCPKKGNKGGQGNTCSYCHKTGHSEKVCFKKKKANQDKQADRAGVDDDFGGFGDEPQPTHRMMREYALSMKAGADPDAEIVLDCGASSHFLTPATADQIQLVPRKGGPTSIEVATAKEGIDFAATESGSAGGLSKVLVSDELGADVAFIARFDQDNGWHTLLGDTRCTVYDGDPMDRSRPPPRVVATGDLGADNMYRVSLSKLVKAREHARIARVSVPTERIMQVDATPAETLTL
jgi:hypothetical protein